MTAAGGDAAFTGEFVEIPVAGTVGAAVAARASARAVPGRSATLARRLPRALRPYLYLLPALGCVGFWVYRPLVQAVKLSFYNWDLLPSQPQTWVGLGNYTRLLHSGQLGSSLWLTVVFIAAMVPFTVVIPTAVGLLTRRARGRLAALYRAAVFAPLLVPPVAGAVIWQWLLDPVHGLVDRATGSSVNWLNSPGSAQLTIVVITGWLVLGFAVLIVRAGLANVSDDYTDAAALDGASRGQVTRWVLLPLLSPTLAFLALMTVLLSAQWSFPVIDTLTQGGPSGATTNIYYFLWQTAFQNFDAGSASAAGVLFFLGFGLVAVTLVRIADRFSFHDN
jgi:multiple sugar transport system permease protein